MIVSHIKLQNWRNFRVAETSLHDLNFVLGPNSVGKSNFLDVFRFLKEVAKPSGGGLQKAIENRGGLKKLRCLHARKVTDVGIEVEFSESDDSEHPSWLYQLYFNTEGSGIHRIIVKREVVYKFDESGKRKEILRRPDKDDQKDILLLTQTALEDNRANRDFRDIADSLGGVSYLHIVPQLLKYAEKIGGFQLEDDPFGQGFLEKIAAATDRQRKSRLGKIENALKSVVTQIKQLEFVRDEVSGTPHLQIKYEHHRPNGAIQREDQFSDGTLRLIALFWMLLEPSTSLLLLEEPELSLNEEIVRQLPHLISKIQRTTRQRKRQILITTHSEYLLKNPGINPEGLIILKSTNDGTLMEGPVTEELVALESGFSPAEVILPRARGSDAQQVLDL